MLDAKSGNQRTQPNWITNRTSDELVAAVTVSELAEYLGVDDADTLLEGIALAATDAVAKYTNVELCKRNWVYRADRYPERQPGFTGIGSIPALGAWWVDLPAWPVIDVTSVTAHDYSFDDDGRVFISSPEAPLVIEYVAGYEEAPAALKQAVLMLASFLYEHRGACDVGEAGKRSGAFALAQGYKRYVGGL